ncbi:MAG: TIM44-like domain-containing protein [Comamonadaceae bacterium]|nr:TIM44-like domain-containing protein [Comamonadaceae bacterium]
MSLPRPPSRSYDAAMPGSSAGAAATGASIPADFDVAGFVRNAKVHFIRLQAANDARNLEDIREFTTPEMFAELKMTSASAATSPRKPMSSPSRPMSSRWSKRKTATW